MGGRKEGEGRERERPLVSGTIASWAHESATHMTEEFTSASAVSRRQIRKGSDVRHTTCASSWHQHQQLQQKQLPQVIMSSVQTLQHDGGGR